MSGITSELAGLAFFVVTGWVALWPARGDLGPVAYHLAALPTGVLASALAAAIASLLGRPLDLASAFGGAVVFAAGMQVILRSLADPANDRRGVGLWSFVIAAGSIAVLGLVFGIAHFTVTNNDSIVSYWPLGVELARTGVFTIPMVATRNVLIPAMSAVYVSFGSDWAYVIYPMLAVSLLGWLATTLVSGPLATAKRRTAWAVAGVAMIALVLEPSFLFHSVFVHSNLMSALYLLMSLTCVWMSARPAAGESAAAIDNTYLVLSGMFAAGLLLARPDGPAYVLIPIVGAIAVLTQSKVSFRSVAAFFAPLLFLVVPAYGAAYVHLGLWRSGKLSGKKTLAVLAALAVTPAGPWVVSWLDRKLPFRVSGERFLGLFVSLSAVMMAAALALKWHSTAQEALQNAWLNLLAGAGGYNYLWWAVAGLLVLALLSRDAMRAGSWTRPAFLSILLFFVFAAIVHGISHAGRVGAGDSLNRVAFHVLPVVVWFVAAVVGRILAGTPPAAGAPD